MVEIVDGDIKAPAEDTNAEGNSLPVHEEPKGFQVPEGFDADLFDTEKGVLLTDKIKERFDDFAATEDKYKKQVLDLRGVISKGVKIPEVAEEYSKDYTPAEEFAHIYSEQEGETKEFLTENLAYLDKMSLDNGMTKEQNKAVRDAFNLLMSDLGIFKPKLSDEDVKAQEEAHKKWVKDQYAKLDTESENGTDVVNKVISHYQNFNILTPEEREAVMSAMDKDITLISAMNKLRVYTHGEEAGSDIPITPSIGGLADDHALAAEYNKKETTDARRMEILQQRIAAGRTGKLPLVAISNN